MIICANCRNQHATIAEVKNCTFEGTSESCRHGLPTGQCVCAWDRGIARKGTHQFVVGSKYSGFCSACMQHYDPGARLVKSGYTWGRWIHLECVPFAHQLWTNPDREYQDALGSKPWLEDLADTECVVGEVNIYPENEDMWLLDTREEIADTTDELQAYLTEQGITPSLITEWRAMLPDVVERTLLMEAALTPEDEETSPWQDEVGEYLLGLEHGESGCSFVEERMGT